MGRWAAARATDLPSKTLGQSHPENEGGWGLPRQRITVGGTTGTVHSQGRHCSRPDSAWLKAPSEGLPPSPVHPSEDSLDVNPKPTASWGAQRPAGLAFQPYLPRAGASPTRVSPRA